MNLKQLGLFALSFLIISSVFAQEGKVQRATVKYTPADYGYALDVPFAWAFRDCFGDVVVEITMESKKMTSTAYIYEGKRYTTEDIGAKAFAKLKCADATVSADAYHNAFRLGNVEFRTVMDWFGGCFGQIHHITKPLGLKDEDYKDKIASLYLKNLKIVSAGSRNYDLESKIEDIAKQRSIEEKLKLADRAFESGNWEEAEALYKEVLQLDRANTHSKSRLEEIEKKKKQEEQDEVAEQKADREEAAQMQKTAVTSTAGNGKHDGFFWGQGYNGTNIKREDHLIGNFRLDYDMWMIAGEPAFKYRFYWEWENAYEGYPYWMSRTYMENIAIYKLEKYPDLWERWNRLKPIYLEIESEILHFKNDEISVAGPGRFKMIPEHIGFTGQEMDWSLPVSPNWNDLFPFVTNMNWRYFKELDLHEEIDAYGKEFGTQTAWARYSFEYSDNIDFFTSNNRRSLSSEFKELTSSDHYIYSTSAKITELIWPVEETEAIVDEFIEREKAEEETKNRTDKTGQEAESRSGDSDFWNTPENTMTNTQKRKIDKYNIDLARAEASYQNLERAREKYLGLLEPIKIDDKYEDYSETDKNIYEHFMSGKVATHFAGKTVRVKLSQSTYYTVVQEGGNFRLKINLERIGKNQLHVSLLDNKYSKGILTETIHEVELSKEIQLIIRTTPIKNQ